MMMIPSAAMAIPSNASSATLTLAVLGTGYVANVTGACFAAMGFKVHCAGLEADRIASLQAGKVPFYEDGLEALVQSELATGNLVYSGDIEAAAKAADIIFVCVSSPTLPNGQPDMKPLNQLLEPMIAGLAQSEGYKLVVERSNLPVGTGQTIKQAVHKVLGAAKTLGPNPVMVDVAAVPQFLREGHAVQDFFKPDHIIIGTESQRAKDLLVNLYSGLNAPMLFSDVTTAELTKQATNAFLAVKISFINSIAQLCERTGADVQLVSKGLGMDARISPHYLQAGIGYGGIFLPRDLNTLVHLASQHHLSFDLLKAAETVNRYQRIAFIERIEEACQGSLQGKTIALWGLAYRPNTDDMRDCPSTQIIWGLQNRGATVRAYDPLAMEAAKEKVKRVTFCANAYEAAEGADAIAIVTEWPEFAQINFSELKTRSACRTLVDGRNLYSPVRVEEQGFAYYSVGRPASGLHHG